MNEVEKIQEKAREMKRSSKALRAQVSSLLANVANVILPEVEEMNGSTPSITVKGRIFELQMVDYGFGPGHNANSSSPEFVEIVEFEELLSGFKDSFTGWNALHQNFTAGDVLFLARNIQEIMKKFDEVLDGRIQRIEEAKKYLV